MKSLHVAFFLLFLKAKTARKFQLCELFYILRMLGMDGYHGYEAKQLVCLAQFPAKGNTQYYAVDHRGVPYYGIFQLSGFEWCNNGRHKTNNKCKINCDNFLDDDIRDDTQCLKRVFREHDLNYWKHYKENCNYATLRLYNFHCSFYFENDDWYKDLTTKYKGRRKSLTVHIHFPRN